MRTEPTFIIEMVRLAAILAGAFGLVITADEQAALVAGVTGVIALVSVALAIWNRLKVFSPATTQKLVDRAAATGDTDIGSPPTGN